jgi:hypothetical protein
MTTSETKTVNSKIDNILGLVKSVLGLTDNALDKEMTDVINNHLKKNPDLSVNIINNSLQQVLPELTTVDKQINDSIMELQKYIALRSKEYKSEGYSDEEQLAFTNSANGFNLQINELHKQLRLLQVRVIVNRSKNISRNVIDPKIIDLFKGITSALIAKMNALGMAVDADTIYIPAASTPAASTSAQSGGTNLDEMYRHKYLKYKNKYLTARKRANF